MRIIISPAKRMEVDTDSLDYMGMPQFMEEADRLKNVLGAMGEDELKRLWKCNDKIARLNVERLRDMNLFKNLTPSVLAFRGIQYQYMAPGIFEDGHIAYIEEHLRILSAFYGILRPFDGIVPYRLEMQAKLSVGRHKNLYEFWGDKLASALYKESDLIINLASREYSRPIENRLPNSATFITCVFGELYDGRIIEKGTLCKMARGQMVRWMAEQNIKDPHDIKNYDCLGYSFCQKYSDEDNFIFLK